jgi:outer membrane protein TolC
MRDTIAAEVTRAYYRVRLRQQQIEVARAQVEASAEALPLNFKGILGGQLRAIEAQQAIQALAAARKQYITTVIDFNRAQFQLLRALGRPPEAPPMGP